MLEKSSEHACYLKSILLQCMTGNNQFTTFSELPLIIYNTSDLTLFFNIIIGVNLPVYLFTTASTVYITLYDTSL